jgi:excisionase family DNA binding protein
MYTDASTSTEIPVQPPTSAPPSVATQPHDAADEVARVETNSPILTLRQAAAYLRVSKAHLLNATKGRIPGTPALRHARVGRRILFKRAWLDQWLEQIAKERNSW